MTDCFGVLLKTGDSVAFLTKSKGYHSVTYLEQGVITRFTNSAIHIRKEDGTEVHRVSKNVIRYLKEDS